MEDLIETKLGKIISVSFGYGGYENACLGLTIVLGSEKAWVTQEFSGTWDSELYKPTEYTEWTEEDRDRTYSQTMRYLSKLLRDANVSSVEQLKNVPVEVKFKENKLYQWRILREVI